MFEADSTTGNRVQGNFIGTDPTGATAIPNQFAGIGIFSPGNTIGGTAQGERNIISGNGDYGILISGGDNSDASANLIQGNFIGTDAGGSAALDLSNFEPDVAGVALAEALDQISSAARL